jgi:hypothetical protein
MRTKKITLRFTASVVVAGLVLMLAGCPKPSSEPPPAKPKPSTKPTVKRPASTAPSLPEMPPETVPVTKPVAPTRTKPNVTPVSQLPNTPSDLEKLYVTKTDFESKINIIYKLSTMNNFQAIEALGQLFHAEPDVDMKVEILDSLENTQGLVDKKLAILKSAVHADQHIEVRESGIEALVSLHDLQSLTVLQPLLTDKSREIREVASAAIIEVQELANKPAQSNPQP